MYGRKFEQRKRKEARNRVKQIELNIRLNPANGGISVNGPIDNKVLALGLLELAKVAIINHQPQAEPLVKPAEPAIPIISPAGP